MKITKYEEIDLNGLDALKEIGSIGTGNAATALSSVLNKEIRMTLPDVSIMGYNEAIRSTGDPEEVVSAVLVRMSGEITGMMLFIQKLDFVNKILEGVLSKKITDYSQLGELELSALVEIGNIVMSSYISALSSLTGVSIGLSVPCISVNMLGGILTVPMVEYGYQTDKIMMIGGNFICESTAVNSNLLLMPEIESLDYILKKLGALHG